MSYKRKRLTFKEQYELVAEMKSGVSKETILQKYGISEITYRRVINRESLVMYRVRNCDFAKKKCLKRTDNTFLDAAVLEWIKNARDKGDPITGPIIKEKALIFNKELNGPETFKASNGWIDCFKNRYNIRFKGEKFSDDPSAAEFSKTLKAKIESENLNLNNIYNADESGILWRLLKACTLPLYYEELKASESKECEDRVTSLFCTNATGSHRIPPLVIGKSKTPECLSNLITKNSNDISLISLKNLGVTYTYHDNALMDNSIFMLWYKDEFIPRVLENQRISGISGKVVLLIDNVPSHPSLDELNAINENFEVVYLPLKETSLIQPLDQGIIAATKILYKKSLLRNLLLSEKSEKPALIQPMDNGSITPAEKRYQISLLRHRLLSVKSEEATKFLRELNLRDCFGMLSIAWNDMKSSTIQKAWKPLLGDTFLLNKVPTSVDIQDPLSNVNPVVNECESPIDSLCFPYEICNQVSELLSKPDYPIERSKEFLLKWFETDYNENHYNWMSLSDSGVVNSTTNDRCEPENITCNFESIIKIEKSEPIFENAEPEEITSKETYEPANIIQIDKSEPFSENPGSVESMSTWSCESESMFEINESEPFCENPEPVKITSTKFCEPESIIEIEKSEPFFENSEPVEITSTESYEPKSVIKIEKSETLFDNPEQEEITSSEAFKCIVKFKNWLQWRAECLPKHLDYIKELESLIIEHMPEK